MATPSLKASQVKGLGAWAAVGFGSGLAPKAPGTFGTLAAIPLWLLIVQMPLLFQWAIVLLAFAMGILWSSQLTQSLGIEDHPSIVWDEFVGFWLTMLIGGMTNLQTLIMGFVLFRFFDILKPWPIGWIDQRVKGGLGIMLDDVLAGLMAGGVLLLILMMS